MPLRSPLSGETLRFAIFPLPGALLFPGMHLPLHIFEDRYRAMISDAMARDRKIGMIQPRGPGDPAPLYEVGCLGHIEQIEAHDDGRYDILLSGLKRFTLIGEVDSPTPFRRIEAQIWDEREDDEVLSSIERASLEQEAKAFAESMDYQVDWESVSRLDDYSMVNGTAQVVPFDSAAKQALLEARGLSERAALIVQLLQFFGARSGPTDPATLQ
ncbi:MAG: LON peptidase substrate-binding domain-containing protein [Novosphingopyxis baekryungensis]|jgi:Lon protease-like protein|uniref:LON peptidase substrate-binding domain-containing protein n=1 Tax=Novosphingopyxis baekryungensis TaxID=279369 RepID=UPI0003B4BB2A|nr:LON peptidase substrate-binding domain-containing protein [Novosphingopyxis baekryungensis]MDE0933217.1 LON peptidase substrate-binding domain-containing protein [Novosphingopyxis baekryungensis]